MSAVEIRYFATVALKKEFGRGFLEIEFFWNPLSGYKHKPKLARLIFVDFKYDLS